MYTLKLLKQSFVQMISLSFAETASSDSMDEHVKKWESENKNQLIEEVKTNISKLKPEEKSKVYQEKLDGILASNLNVAQELTRLNQEVLKTQMEIVPEKLPLVKDYYDKIFVNQKLDNLQKDTKLTITFPKELDNEIQKKWLIFSLWDLPKEVSSIKYNWNIFNRVSDSIRWEFVDKEGNVLEVTDKMSFSIESLRDEKTIKKSEEKVNEWLEEKTIFENSLISKIREKWMDENMILEKAKQDLLSQDDGIIDEKDENQMKEKFAWYPENLDKLNFEIETILDCYIYEEWIYSVDAKKVQEKIDKELEALKDEKDEAVIEEKKQEVIEHAFQSQVDFATKNYPSNWSEKVSKWNLTNELLEKFPILWFVNLLFKWIFWVDLFKDLESLDGTEIDYNDPEYVRRTVWNMIWWADSWKLWSLSEHFESGWKWPYAHNANDNWLPSFGTYQLRWEALWRFAIQNWIHWDFNQTWKNTEFSKNWKAAVDKVWKEKFKEIEHNFIKATHYDKQVAKIKSETGLDVDSMPMTIRNIAWSISVQHWPNSDVFVDAVKSLGKLDYTNIANQITLVEKIYATRTWKYSSQRARYYKEKYIVLQNLKWVSSHKELPRWIASYPKEFENWSTMCSRTAYKNLTHTLWVPTSATKQWNAKDVYEQFLSSWDIQKGLSSNSTANVADLFMESKKYPQYGHRSVAFKSWNEWYVLDPYLPVNWRYSTNPIAYNDYMSYLQSKWRKFLWAKVYA